jgi:Fe-S oxidoreductase
VKLAGGVDQRRPVPRFAPMTLQEWFGQRRGTANPAGRPVVLFPDTFNNHFHTGAGVACVEAIEAAGWRVIMPEGHVCCGRPLYDYGFLDSADRYLHKVLDVLRPYVRDGVPVVGTEPSCLAVFKDELRKMLPHDDAARLARNAYHFGEFLSAFGIEPPSLPGRSLVGSLPSSGDGRRQAGAAAAGADGPVRGRHRRRAAAVGMSGFLRPGCAMSMARSSRAQVVRHR